MLRSSYAAARSRHAAARQEAYAGAREDAIAERVCGPELRIADIDADAIAAWKRTWTGVHPSGAGGWNWPGLVERLPSRAAVLPVAIWYGDDLCALALGQTSRHRANGSRNTVTLTYVERRPEPPPVQLRGAVLYLAISVARFYSTAVGARRLRLRNPDRNLLWYYETLGFGTVWKSGYPVYSEQEI